MDIELELYPNISEPVRAGDSLSITCRATINTSFVDVDFDVSMHLESPQEVNASDRVENTSPGLHLVQKSISYHNISALNSGLFVCRATMKPSSMNHFLRSASENKMFDLTLSKHCNADYNEQFDNSYLIII